MVGHKPKTALKARLPPMQWTLLAPPKKNDAPDCVGSKSTQSSHQTLNLFSSKGANNFGMVLNTVRNV